MGVVWTFLLSSIFSLLSLPLSGRWPDIDRDTVPKQPINQSFVEKNATQPSSGYANNWTIMLNCAHVVIITAKLGFIGDIYIWSLSVHVPLRPFTATLLIHLMRTHDMLSR